MTARVAGGLVALWAATASAQALERFGEEGSTQPTAVPFGTVRVEAGTDTRFESAAQDSLAENVFLGRARARLGADIKLSARERLFIEARALLRGAAQRGGRRAKGLFEPDVGEAFVDWYRPAVDVRLGNQLVAFGANPAFAPTDVLNPRDFRTGFLSTAPEDSKLPAFAVRAQGNLGDEWTWVVAYFPFFTPHRYAVFGQDEAFIQPRVGLGLEQSRVDPSVEDLLQPRLLETKRPPPFAGDLGLRVSSRLGDVTVGAAWVWMNEKLPQVRVDPELEALLAQSQAGEPLNPALALSVQNRLRAGEVLYQGTYSRQHLFSLSGSALVGSSQLDVDLAFTPAQTFVDERFRPLRKPVATWVVGLTQAEDSPWMYSLTYVGMAALGVEAQQQLFLFEPATARGVARTGWLHLLVAEISRRIGDDRWTVGVRGAFEPVQRSYALGPRVEYRPNPTLSTWLALELYEGPGFSPLGYFGWNDQVLAGLQLVLF